MQKKKVIGFILMLIAILIISFGGRNTYAAGTPKLMERETPVYIAGKGYTYYAIGAKRSGNTKYTADLISSITFVANKNVPTSAEASWDASYTNGDNEVIAWVIPNTTDSTKYDLYIGFDNTIIQAPKVSKILFREYKNCTIINNLTMLDTAIVTDMTYMFYNCSQLTSLDVSNFNTTNVTDMYEMFYNCSNLTSLDLSSFDTSNVTDMDWMFAYCSNLTSLDLSSFNTSKVIYMNHMFYNCSNLTSLDVSNFNKTNVTDMSWMFANCSNLTSLDVSSFDTSKVKYMSGMFGDCSNLTSLDVSSFDTSNVTAMNSMFVGCSKLTSLDVSNFNTTNVTDMYWMFANCSNLTSLDVSNFNTTNVTTMESMFNGCSKLKAIILDKSITASSQAMKLSTGTSLENLPNAILYVHDTASEKLYETATNYATTFADSRDANGDLYRIRPILEVAGENPVKVKIGETYDATVDAGATIAGFDKTNASEYTQYGYNYTTAGLPLNTSAIGTKQVTYTLTKTKNGTTTNGMTATRTVNVVELPKLMERETYTYIAGKGNTYYAIGAKRSGNTKYTADLISSITFVANKNVPSTAEVSWDVSYTNGDNEVIAWVIPNTTDSTKYDLYIGFDNTIIQAPKDSKSLFEKYTNCTIINNLTMLDTAIVTDMSYMFHYCKSLTSLDVSSFDTSKVTTMYDMFYMCSNLTSLDLSSFNTSNVTNMMYMFYDCSNLTSLDLSNFNTTNVTNMGDMFEDCSKLTSLDVSNFNTSNVTYMYGMFGGCSNLTSLDVSNFNTTNVTSMGSMFSDCSKLTSLDVSNFNTTNVTNMSGMFWGCSKLTSLDVSNFNTIKVTYMSLMFYRCINLTSLDVSNFNTSNVTNMGVMFGSCGQLTSLDVSNFNTTKVTNMGGMFGYCSKLTSLDVSGFDTSKVKTMGSMFSNCNSLKNIDLRSFDTSSLDGETYTMSSTALGVDVNYMFSYCGNLESIIIGDKFNRLDGYEMFDGCNKLKAIITTKTITVSSDAPTLSGTENVTNSNGKIIAGPNGLKNLPNAILYAPDTASEKLYEAATNYATTFADSRDTEGDLYRIRPILEVAGENPVKVKIGETYDATVDAGATIAGFGVTDSGEYTQYGYNYTTVGLPVDTTTKGTKQVTYTLTKTKNGTTNGMTTTRTVNVVGVPMLMKREDSAYIIGAKRSGNTKYTADLVSTITFVSNTNIPTTAEASWDVSYTNGDGEVIAWVIPNATDSTKYDLFIGANNETLQAPINSNHLFGEYTNCTAINNLTMLDTSSVTYMSTMFYWCINLTSLDVSNFNTTNVTNMGGMFLNCSKLTSLDVSKFDTSKVTDMGMMFFHCSSLTNLDVSNFDTSNVTDIESMFYYCNKLASLDVSNFDTSKVTNMDGMFYNCNKLPSLDVSKFNTSNVTSMSNMFYDCGSLTNLDVSKFDTSKVANMSYMFYGCRSLTSLDVSKFDTSKVTNMNYMFYACNSLKNLDVSSFNTSLVTKMSNMFDGCSGLTSLDISNFNTSKVTDMGMMFSYCSSLTNLDVSNFDTSNVTDMSYMFWSCSNLVSLDVNNFDTSKVTNMESIFSYCSSLTHLNVSNFNTSSVKEMSSMFNSCIKLTSLDVSNFDTSNVTSMRYMFWNCNSLISVDISNFDTSKVTNMEYMFNDCSKLKAIILDKSITASSQAMKLSTGTSLENLPNAILYVHDTASEKLYEAATNYSTTFADNRDTEGDLYRIRPILEVAGENPAKASLNGIYDEKKDAGATIAGFGVTDSGEYTQYGYNYTTSGLPVDTTTKGTKQVTYTLTKTKNGTITNGMTATRDVNVVGVPVLMEREECTYIAGEGNVYYAIGAKRAGKTKYTADLISSITLVTNKNVSANAEASWDASYISGDNEVIAWVVPNTTDSTKYDLFIGANDTTIQAPINSNWLLAQYTNCTAINNLTMLDTSNVTNMKSMFYSCSNLTSLDISNFDTSKITDMKEMFSNCSNLTSLDLSSFNTSKVTTMYGMFGYCSKLTSLEVSNFDTSNVTNMELMFYNCSKLTSLDVSNFDTSNVRDMNLMFSNCRALISLDVSSFNTSKVTDMRSMFSNCSKLTNLDVSNFNTSNVTNMEYMFYDCEQLTSLDLSNFNTSNVTNMGIMFSNCSNLTSLDVSNFNTTNVTNMGHMFFDCSSLTSLDVSKFNTSNVIDMSAMFGSCRNLTSLDVGNFDTSKVINMGWMFSNCSNLTSLDVSNFNTSNVTDMRIMFYNCSKLTSLDVSNFDTTKVRNMENMFKNCRSLKAVILDKDITSSDEAMKLLTGNDLENLPDAILYVHDTESEKLYEAATNYSTVFADSRDANGDLYRIRPILEVAGDNPAKVSLNGIYDETKDAGATIAGFGVTDSGEYTQYGYNYATSGLPVDTTSVGTKQVTYTLTKTKNGTTTNGMTATRDVKVTEAPKLMERDYDTINGIKYANYAIGAKRAGKTKYKKDLISTITLVSNKNVPTTAEASWDVSYTNGSNEVIAWVIPNATDSTKYDLYIGADDTSIQAPANSVDLFSNYTNCTEINNLEMLDTSKVTSMMYMFHLCNNLTKVNVSNFDTSKVTTMYGMFGYCSKLTSLDVSKFNTSNVTNMFAMFGSCSSLTNLDVTNFDTSKVTSMLCMFTDCRSLTSLDVSNFNTSNVTDMKEMFSNCRSLKELDLSSFDTSKVTTMNSMLSNCGSLTNLNVSSFNTSKVTDMSLMFASCSSLTNLDVSNFNTSNVTTFAAMFSTCSSLENLNLATFDTRNARTIGFMFYNCSSLTNVVVTGTNFRFTKLDHTTAGVTGTYESLDINCVFAKCSSLTGIDLSSWNITTSENMNELFADCTNLKSIVLGRNFAALKGADMFKNCDNLRAIITKRTTPLTLVTGTGAETVGVNNPKVLYVETKQLESSFESASNYASVFGADRIRPILGVAGENPVKVKIGETYDATVDAGATIAGFGVADSGEYTQYGYNYTTVGLPVDTTSTGTKQVTYTLTKTKDGTTINGMSVTRNIEILEAPKLMERETYDYINGKGNVYYAIGAKRSGNTKYTADLISSITFVANKNVPSTAEASWDASYTNGDNEVIAWVMPNTTDSTKYDLYIGFDNTIIQAPKVSENLFRVYTNCTIINNLTMLDTSNVTDMSYMFYNCSQLTSLDVSKFDTSKVINMSWMFYYCSNLTSLNLSSFNTSNVTTMHNMFAFCSNLTSLDVSKFDTSNVTNMASMFVDCSKLTSLDVSKFDTSNVTNMSSMFSGCSKLTSLDVSNFNTSNVTYMGVMFEGCSKLTSLDVSKFNTSNVTNMNAMFDSCRSLTSLDVTNFDTSKVTDLSIMFDSCRSLSALDVSSFDTSNVTSMSYMFYGCSNLTSLDVSSFDTSNVVFMSYMFYGCSKLKAIILDKSITASSQAMKLSTGTSLENLPNAILYVPDTASEKLYEAATNYATTFADSRDANGDLYRIRPILEVAGENPAKVSLNGIYDETKDAGATIAGFTKAESSEYTQYGYNYTTAGLPLNTSAIGTKQVTYTLRKTENGTTTNGMTTTRTVNVVGLPKLMERETSDYINNQYVYYAIGAKRSGNKKYTADLISTITFVANKNVPSTAEASWDVSYTKGNNEVIAWVIPNATDNTKYDLYIGADATTIEAPIISSNLFAGYKNCTAINNLTMLNTVNVTNMSYMFLSCKQLTSLDVSGFDTSNVTDMGSMFNNCSNLTSLDISNFNTSNVTKMGNMFCYCGKLTSLDVSNFDTSNVTNMSWMFSDCSNLTSLDLSNFNTSKVTNMEMMFYLCSNLTSLDLSNFNTSNVTNMMNMFSGCSELASLDVGNFDTSKVTDMKWMFLNCSNLTSLDVSNFNTSKVTNMESMFSLCSNLTSLDVSGFDTSKVKTMGFMFNNCDSLKSIDLRSFDTSSLDGKTYNMSGAAFGVDVNYMFSYCGNLESIIIGDKFNRLDGYDMFRDCNKLKAIITTKTITDSSDAPTLSGTENVTNSNGEIIAGPNGLINLPNAILYAPDTESEKLYEAATNYATTFADSRDANGDLYRIRPILEVDGENPVKVKIGETYDATVDAGATIAGFGVTDGGEYTQYGYDYTTSGLPVDTTSVGTKQVTYTLTKTENGTTTNGMTATRDVKVVGVPMLMERESSDYINKQNVYYAIGAKRSGNTKYTADLISTITFVNNTNIPTTAETSWDVSFTSGDNEVIAWVIPNATDSTKYDLYIGTDSETVEAPGNSYNLFGFYKECTEINNLTILDTSNVTNMGDMFEYCKNLTSLDISNFNTSKVTNMTWMFYNCSNLTSLDLSSFNTSKVTYMYSMFSNCSKLTSLDLSSFNTSKVTNMGSMFYSCSNLTELNVNNFNTSNVTNMEGMFSGCSNLTSLDVSNFDTSKVTNMGSMFWLCGNLTSLDVSNFNTLKVTNINHMFYSCRNLTSLDISNFDTTNVTDMSYMFCGCSKLTSLDVSNFNTTNVTNMSGTFSGCSNLTSLDVSNFNTSNVTNMSGTFYNCSNLISLDVSNFNTSNVTNMSNMFHLCSNLTSLDVSGFDTSKVKTMGCMFDCCTNLKNIDLRSFDTSSLDGKTYNMSSSTVLGVDVNYMFDSCGNLESIIIGDKFNRLDGYDMFRDCNKLKAIITTKTITTSSDAPTLSGTENVTNSNGKIIAGPNGLIDLPNAILYAPDTASEKLYEAATNYATIFADSRDTEGDLYRVRPILEVAGDNPAKVSLNGIYDETKDAGATIAGFGVADSGEYTQYGYNYIASGLPVDTTSVGTKQVTYTLTKTKNGTTTNGMTTTRDVEIVAADITGSVSISGDCVYGETLIVDTSKILPENADLEYKWYINDTNSTTGGTLVKEANSDSGLGNRYFISGDAIDKYVYVEVIASLENYTTKTFTDVVGPVQRADINRVDASLIHDIFVYDGNPKEPEVYVVDLRGPGDLTLGEDYTLEYKDNVNVGTGKVIVKGINKYTGELELTFKIIKAPEFELVNLTPEWTTSNVSIAINILDVGAGIKKVLFENEEVTLQNNTTTVVVDKNGLYTAEVFDIYGNAVAKELYVGNIDREVPVIEEVKHDGVTFAKEVKVEVKATDTGSGVYAYAVSEKDAEPTTWTQITPVENMTIFNFTISSNGTYYLFVKDAVGNITKYNKQIVITNIDNAPPVIKLFNIIDDYTFTTEVFIEINAEDDTGVEGLLLSNEMLTNSQVEDSDNWVPYTETVLYSLPSKDGNHTVYAWVRDSVGKISEYAQDNTLLLNKYVGNNGINNTSFKFLVKDENYNFAKKITESNIKILVKDDSDKVTYSTEYGVNITSISLPVVYGPAQEGTQMMTGEYYTITVENIGGKGTVYLVFDENSVVDKAGNKLANKEIKTDVEVELNTPKITLGTTEIQVSDPDGNLIQAIKVNGKTVLLTSGKITYEKLKTEYGITLKTDDTIEAFDKHSNSVMVTVQ